MNKIIQNNHLDQIDVFENWSFANCSAFLKNWYSVADWLIINNEDQVVQGVHARHSINMLFEEKAETLDRGLSSSSNVAAVKAYLIFETFKILLSNKKYDVTNRTPKNIITPCIALSISGPEQLVTTLCLFLTWEKIWEIRMNCFTKAQTRMVCNKTAHRKFYFILGLHLLHFVALSECDFTF